MYDPTKDVLVADLGQFGEDENNYLEFGIYQYNGGARKLRVTRVTTGKTGKIYRESVAKMNASEFAQFVTMVPDIKGVLL